MRRVLNKALGLYLYCGLSLTIFFSAPTALEAAPRLPQVNPAQLNTWITPPAQGVRVNANDLESGHIMRHLIEHFAGPDGGAFVNAIYSVQVKPGHYTSLKKAPPKSFHQIKGFWVAGDPYRGRITGPNRVQWIYSDPSYTGYNFKCQDFGARINFLISPKSKGTHLYLVILSARHGLRMSMKLESPGAPDAEVARYGSSPPWCSESQGVAWGNVLTRHPLVIPAPQTNQHPSASSFRDCGQGCFGSLSVRRVQQGPALPSLQAGPDCPQGYRRLELAKGKEECLGCDPGKKLVILGSSGDRQEAACLQCPKGYANIMMKREKGKDAVGKTWARDTYACLRCERGYQLRFHKLRRGTRPDGSLFAEREAACWRCPIGKRVAEKVETQKLPDGSSLEIKSYSCN